MPGEKGAVVWEEVKNPILGLVQGAIEQLSRSPDNTEFGRGMFTEIAFNAFNQHDKTYGEGLPRNEVVEGPIRCVRIALHDRLGVLSALENHLGHPPSFEEILQQLARTPTKSRGRIDRDNRMSHVPVRPHGRTKSPGPDGGWDPEW